MLDAGGASSGCEYEAEREILCDTLPCTEVHT